MPQNKLYTTTVQFRITTRPQTQFKMFMDCNT